jgi:DNA-binding transcriptional MerR regulator
MIEVDDELTIGEAARESGLSEDTLRWYERIGLTPRIERSASGHRRYRRADLGWLAFVSRLRATGMSIEVLQRYSELARAGPKTSPERRAILADHSARIAARIDELHNALAIVRWKMTRYDEFLAADAVAPAGASDDSLAASEFGPGSTSLLNPALSSDRARDPERKFPARILRMGGKGT